LSSHGARDASAPDSHYLSLVSLNASCDISCYLATSGKKVQADVHLHWSSQHALDEPGRAMNSSRAPFLLLNQLTSFAVTAVHAPQPSFHTNYPQRGLLLRSPHVQYFRANCSISCAIDAATLVIYGNHVGRAYSRY
jgi:hypothetical protein